MFLFSFNFKFILNVGSIWKLIILFSLSVHFINQIVVYFIIFVRSYLYISLNGPQIDIGDLLLIQVGQVWMPLIIMVAYTFQTVTVRLYIAFS